MKGDLGGAIAKLENAYALARASDDEATEAALVCEELARAWARRKSFARALHFASKAAALAPGRKSGWSTLAKTCELIASRANGPSRAQRRRILFAAAAHAFGKAAALTTDREDKRWLLELAADSAKAAKSVS